MSGNTESQSSDGQQGCFKSGQSAWWKHKLVVTIFTYCIFLVNRTVRKVYPYTKTRLAQQWLPQEPEYQCGSAPGHNQSCGTIPYDIWDSGRQEFDSKDNAENFQGALDAEFMFIYAFGTYFSGWIGDRSDPRYVIAVGSFLQAIAYLGFGVLTEHLHWYNHIWYIFTFAILAIGQSTSWPNLVDIMSNWYGRHNRGLVLGIWSSCQNMGNVVGSAVVIAVLDYGYDVPYTVTAAIAIACGIMVFFGLVSTPAQIPGEQVPAVKSTEHEHKANPDEEESSRGVSLFTAILLPGVLPYCLCVACLKFVNQAFFAWLPYYLHEEYSWSSTYADRMTTFYDIGAVIGTIAGGVISDKLGRRSPIVTVMLLFSVGTIFAFLMIPGIIWVNVLVMFFMGVFVGGCYTLCVSTVSADLGSQPALANDEKALATVTGLVDGTASLGAAIGLYCVSPIKIWLGWNGVFYAFMIMNLVGALLISRITYYDIKHLLERRTEGDELVEGIDNEANDGQVDWEPQLHQEGHPNGNISNNGNTSNAPDIKF